MHIRFEITQFERVDRQFQLEWLKKMKGVGEISFSKIKISYMFTERIVFQYRGCSHSWRSL